MSRIQCAACSGFSVRLTPDSLFDMPRIMQRRHIGVAVTGISVDEGTQVMSVSVTADLSSLIPGILPFEGVYQVTGTAKARMVGRLKPAAKKTIYAKWSNGEIF